jgi:hypothetical protein
VKEFLYKLFEEGRSKGARTRVSPKVALDRLRAAGTFSYEQLEKPTEANIRSLFSKWAKEVDQAPAQTADEDAPAPCRVAARGRQPRGTKRRLEEDEPDEDDEHEPTMDESDTEDDEDDDSVHVSAPYISKFGRLSKRNERPNV